MAHLTRGRGIINGRVRLLLQSHQFAAHPSLTNMTQTIMAPLAALTMAGLLFVYTRTSIRAAKLNAHRQREADDGHISWHKEESLGRNHGQLAKKDWTELKRRSRTDRSQDE